MKRVRNIYKNSKLSNGIRKPILLTSVATTMVIAVSACGTRASDGAERTLASDSIPMPVKEFVQAIVDNDSVKFASMISYPLQRPYPLPDINDNIEMKAYYATIVDDSLRTIISSTLPEGWKEYGWRGWSITDGNYVWIDDKIYDIPYLSVKEQKRLKELQREEIESLTPSMREGWEPETCLLESDNGKLYRIDRRKNAQEGKAGDYRLSIYPQSQPLDSIPKSSIIGIKESEGTELNSIYTFTSPEGTLIFYSEYPEEEPGYSQMEVRSNGKPNQYHHVKKTYWLHHVRKDNGLRTHKKKR